MEREDLTESPSFFIDDLNIETTCPRIPHAWDIAMNQQSRHKEPWDTEHPQYLPDVHMRYSGVIENYISHSPWHLGYSRYKILDEGFPTYAGMVR